MMLDLGRYGKMLETVKLLLGLDLKDGESEKQQEMCKALLTFSLSKVIRDVSNYTNISVDDLPSALDHTIVDMTVQVIQTHHYLSLLDGDDADSGEVQSLSEGDTSVTFKSTADIYTTLQQVNTISDNFINILNNFRVVSW